MDEKIRILLKGHLDKSREKLGAAEILLKEKRFEDAVSRAYYAAFHAAQAVLLTEGLTASTHQGVVNLFGLRLVKTGKLASKFGKFLSNLKDDRENGDYEIFSGIDRETAEEAFREASEFVNEAEKYLKKAAG